VFSDPAATEHEKANVAIETHWARNESFRLADLADELVDRGAAVLVASGNAQAVLAAKAATTTIPIVFGLAADPVEIGLVSSLDHPGGNITGVTSISVTQVGHLDIRFGHRHWS
jgi:putative ABC transport system substrate-binding protein